MSRSLSNRFTLVLAILGSLVAAFLTVKHFMPDLSAGCAAGPGGCAGVLSSSYGSVGPVPTAVFGLGMYLALIGLCVVRGRLLQAEQQEQAERALAYAHSHTEQTGTKPVDAQLEAELTHFEQEYIGTDRFAGDTQAEEISVLPPSTQFPAIRRADMLIFGLALLGAGISWWLQYTAIFVLHGICPWCLLSATLITLILLIASFDFLVDGRVLSGEQKLLVGVGGFLLVMMGVMYYPNITESLNVKPASQSVPRDIRPFLMRPDSQVKGDPKARFLIVEFADYQCPACGFASKKMSELLAKRPKDIRLVFRNMPLDRHEWSEEAARAALAAARQNKFWEMHELLFASQNDMELEAFDRSRFTQFAHQLKLDVDKFERDFASREIQNLVERDLEDARAAGVGQTPTFFVVTDKQIVSFEGIGPLESEFLNNPNHPLWKESKETPSTSKAPAGK